jgi:glycerol-3-phosphate dehydrogenase
VTVGTAGNRIGVVGGGINGAGVTWELTRRGYDVTLFEKGRVGEQTSWKTTKMIHGGLRYLEHFHVGVVRESLRDRAWLLKNLPELVQPIEILLPIYRDSPRSRVTIKAGLALYDLLAGRENIERHRWWTAKEMIAVVPLFEEGLRGGYSYWDAQVDDRELVRAVVRSAKKEGATIRELTRVDALRRDGRQWIAQTSAGDEQRFDLVINAAGPWMNELLAENKIRAQYVLSLVRGSHLVLKHRVGEKGVLLQSTDDMRVFFVLPWKDATLVGTTEIVHREPLDNVEASSEEVDYLIERFNGYFEDAISRDDISATFAGVRPLVGRATNPGAISRDYRITRKGNLINIFGGKMTTFMSLSKKVAMRVDNYFGRRRAAKPARFYNPPS